MFVFTDVDIHAANNYCRNPNGADNIWCYVAADYEKEECHISTGGRYRGCDGGRGVILSQEIGMEDVMEGEWSH